VYRGFFFFAPPQKPIDNAMQNNIGGMLARTNTRTKTPDRQ
jgi:hypothetical protein